MKASEITTLVNWDITKIRFGDVTHLAFFRAEVVGFQSWRSAALFSLEITFKGGAAIVTEYDDEDKWKRVIALVEENLTP